MTDGISEESNSEEPPIRDLSEADWELYALDLLAERGWPHIPGRELGPSGGVRKSWRDLVLYPRLRQAIVSRYPQLPSHAVEDAIKDLLDQSTANELRENHRFHQKLTTTGAKVSYTDPLTDEEHHVTVRPVDFSNPHGNDLVAASQVRVVSDKDRTFVFDIVLYVNGLPLGLIELKKASSTDSSRSAYDQIQNYRRELKTTAFATILATVATDGITARIGTPFTPWQHMAPWHATEDGVLLRKEEREDGRALERMVDGPLEPDRFLDVIANFLSYSAEGTGAVDTVKMAKAHQYIAVKKAVQATESAVATDGRAGVVWHTQGAGKSEEMLFYTAKVSGSRTPELSNPTVVLLTDRIDLDSQLYATFAKSRSLHQAVGEPVKAEDATQLRELLTTRAGGVVFTTLQKFRLSKEEREAKVRHPELSPRRDIIVIVDEAHRSHYDFYDGFARHLRDALPHATFIAFTGTPIDNTTGNTRAVFGDDIHTYDLTQAVDDGATVPVFYEPHLTKVKIPDDADLDELNAQAEGLVEGLSEEEKRKAQRKFASYESLIGAPERVEELADGILTHWDARSAEMKKLTGKTGKGMVVCASRAIAARLFEALARRRPDWIGERDKRTGLLRDDTGRIKVVFTGNPSRDDDEVVDYVRTPTQLKEIQKRVLKEDDELELIIVQSLWLTGFDAPPLHTLYLDRRMRGAALMQAIARVNRTWGEKPSGLVVDFQGVARYIEQALIEYSDRDREKGTIGAHISEAADAVREQHQRLTEILHGCAWREVLTSGERQAYREAILEVLDFFQIAEPHLSPDQPTRRQRFMHYSRLLAQAFTLCPTAPEIQDLLPDIQFFEAVRTHREKLTAQANEEQGLATAADVRLLIEQLNAQAVAVDGIVDIYDAAGIVKPDLSHLDEDFIDELKSSRHPHLAIEALRQAMTKQIRETQAGNITREKLFTDKMKAVMNRYINGLLTTAQVIDLLVSVARESAADHERARELGLTKDELDFYDAVAANPSAVEEMGTGILAQIAKALVEQVRNDVTIDWKVREQARDRIRAKVKRLLRRFGYPPDRQPEAIERVLKQTEVKAEEWA
ncbi:type I restriction endonuclease subunit R [Streptomyces malaysiensis]|uniref:type I restriction endonuclease subunit R n=1 Tax=Streptomyces malaysiensis TaxID=92644 RepID=UPI0036948C19